jgi:hypothetical protein
VFVSLNDWALIDQFIEAVGSALKEHELAVERFHRGPWTGLPL